MKAKGVDSVRSRVCNLSDFTQDVTVESMLAAIRTAYESIYGPVADFAPTPEEVAQVVPYYQKQSSWQWRMGKTPQFDLELDTRFPWGGVQMLFTLKNSLVDQVDVYSDAMDAELAAEIQKRLTGCRFGSGYLHAALTGSGNQQLEDVAQYILDQHL